MIGMHAEELKGIVLRVGCPHCECSQLVDYGQDVKRCDRCDKEYEIELRVNVVGVLTHKVGG